MKMENEKRLIDANLLEVAFGNAVKCCRTDLMRSIYSVALNAVNDCPTVDAVEVVRCEDCKHRAIGDNICIHPNRIGDGYIEIKDDDFCSYGERREGE